MIVGIGEKVGNQYFLLSPAIFVEVFFFWVFLNHRINWLSVKSHRHFLQNLTKNINILELKTFFSLL